MHQRIDEFADFGKVDDLLELGIDLFFAQPQDRAMDQTADRRLQTLGN